MIPSTIGGSDPGAGIRNSPPAARRNPYPKNQRIGRSDRAPSSMTTPMDAYVISTASTYSLAKPFAAATAVIQAI